METILRSGERLDDLQIKGYEIIQNPGKFCYGMDAVLLSNFAKVKNGETVLDIGTGTGILPILLAAKTKGKHFIGLEVQEDSAEMARRSVAHNHLEERIEIITENINKATKTFPKIFFDVIVTNPPYMINEHGLTNQNDAIKIARHEVLCNLDDILRESAKLLHPARGRFYMVHRPFRLAEILMKMSQHGIEPKRMRLVYPYVDKEPNMVLIEGVRGAKSRMTVERPLIVYEKDRNYTQDILNIYGLKK